MFEKYFNKGSINRIPKIWIIATKKIDHRDVCIPFPLQEAKKICERDPNFFGKCQCIRVCTLPSGWTLKQNEEPRKGPRFLNGETDITDAIALLGFDFKFPLYFIKGDKNEHILSLT